MHESGRETRSVSAFSRVLFPLSVLPVAKRPFIYEQTGKRLNSEKETETATRVILRRRARLRLKGRLNLACKRGRSQREEVRRGVPLVPLGREISSSIEFALRFDRTRKVEREYHFDFQVSMQVLGALAEW